MSAAARIIAGAEVPFAATASNGTRYTLRRMAVLDRLRLFKAVGATLATNDAYLGVAYLAFAVSAIDDVPVPLPANEAQIEALVGRIGDAGIEAIAQAFATEEAAKAETAPGNSAGTPT